MNLKTHTMNLKTYLIFFLLMLFGSFVNAQNFSGGYNFNLPADDTTSAVFLPYFPAVPITNQDFISVNENGNFSVSSNRVRFWGTNLVADGAVPEKTKAWYIAGRLRNMGFNLVRFHHIDNSWTDGSLFEHGSNTRHLNPVTLDRLEYLINQLKINGIYVDMNLNVSRAFNSLDGVEDADSLVDFAKGVTLFDPQLIFLQKEYAAQLLTHVNPYTGQALKDDPVMGVLEVTNENSLYRMWHDGQLKKFSMGGSLTIRHVKMLDSLWNKFLIEKYTNTVNLQAAWNEGTTPPGQANLVVNGDFETPPISENWQLELHDDAAATMLSDNINPYNGNYSGKVTVTNTTGTNWHIQFKQAGITVYKDSIYTVKFSARSDENKSISVSAMRDNDPYNGYYGQNFLLNTGWNTFEFSFIPDENNFGQTRISFSFADSGNYWFDDVSLSITGVRGLQNGENLENGTVNRTDYYSSITYTNQRVKDMSEFYINLQNKFRDEMMSFLKDTIGVICPIVIQNWNAGPGDLITQSQFDFIDNHSYWDHPIFPGVPWSSTDWYIENKPMVQSQQGGTIPHLFSGVPFMNKPYTISEYNHPFPNRFQTESMLFTVGYSSFHNADALMFFDYNSGTDWDADFVDNYFSIDRNHAMMGLVPSSAFAFRNGFISKANETIKLNFIPQDVYLLPKHDTRYAWEGPNLYPKTLALKHAVRNESFNAATTTDFSQLPPEPVNPYKTDTDEIIFNTNGLLTVNTPKFIGLSGLLNNFSPTAAGNLTLISASDFGTLTWVSLGSDSLSNAEKSLITISTKLQNTGMIWDGITTIHDDWGHTPTQLHPITVGLNLNIFADSLTIYPLNSSGNVLTGTEFTVYPATTNRFVFTLDQTVAHTMWFGIEKFGSGTTPVDNEESLPVEFKLNQNYPNPFNNQTIFNYSVGMKSEIEIAVYDILGNKIKTLFSGEQAQGKYQINWDGTNDSGSSVTSGIYFTRFYSSIYSSTIKTILLK